MRYVKNNEELSVSKYILSRHYLPSVPFKCHLWSDLLFVAKRKTSLFFFKVSENLLTLCWTMGSRSKIKARKTFILRSWEVPIKAARPFPSPHLLSAFLWKWQTCPHLNNVTARKKTSDEHRIQLLKVPQRKSKKFFFPKEFIISNSHELLYLWSCPEYNDFIALSANGTCEDSSEHKGHLGFSPERK